MRARSEANPTPPNPRSQPVVVVVSFPFPLLVFFHPVAAERGVRRSLAAARHVPEAGRRHRRRAAAGDGHPHEQQRRRHVLPGGGRDGLRRAGGGAGRRVVHRALRLLRRLRQLLRDVRVPVHHVRADRGDRGPGVDVVRRERGAVRAGGAAHGVPVRLLLLLPRQDARPVRPPGGPLRRLLRPLLLRVLRPLPGVPRAHQEGLPHELGMAREHGEAGAHCGDHATPLASWDDPLIRRPPPACLTFVTHSRLHAI